MSFFKRICFYAGIFSISIVRSSVFGVDLLDEKTLEGEVQDRDQKRYKVRPIHPNDAEQVEKLKIYQTEYKIDEERLKENIRQRKIWIVFHKLNTQMIKKSFQEGHPYVETSFIVTRQIENREEIIGTISLGQETFLQMSTAHLTQGTPVYTIILPHFEEKGLLTSVRRMLYKYWKSFCGNSIAVLMPRKGILKDGTEASLIELRKNCFLHLDNEKMLESYMNLQFQYELKVFKGFYDAFYYGDLPMLRLAFSFPEWGIYLFENEVNFLYLSTFDCAQKFKKDERLMAILRRLVSNDTSTQNIAHRDFQEYQYRHHTTVSPLSPFIYGRTLLLEESSGKASQLKSSFRKEEAFFPPLRKVWKP